MAHTALTTASWHDINYMQQTDGGSDTTFSFTIYLYAPYRSRGDKNEIVRRIGLPK